MTIKWKTEIQDSNSYKPNTFLLFMPRRARVLKRPTILEDRTFNSILVSRVVNRVMWDGKKTVANKIVVNAMNMAADKLSLPALEILETAVANVKPNVEVKSMRVGGASYQVPVEPYPARALRLALTWIIDAARKIKGKPMTNRLSQIIVDSFNSEGPAVAKRNTVHQTAAGNKAFAHFASRAKKKA
jgi:small subunit ribosomal protein S7